MDQFVTDSLAQLKSYEQTTFNLIVGIRNENFRIYMRHFDEDKNGYWHFKWRFETWNTLGLSVKLDDGKESFIHVKVLGTTEDFRDNSYDGASYEYYICEVSDSNNKALFPIGLKVACFYYNNSKYISVTVGNMTEPEDKYKFGIVGLGSVQVGFGNDVLASEKGYSPRAKDFKI